MEIEKASKKTCEVLRRHDSLKATQQIHYIKAVDQWSRAIWSKRLESAMCTNDNGAIYTIFRVALF